MSSKAKFILALTIIFAIIILILLYLHYVVNPIIIDATEAKVYSLTQDAIENAVYDVIKDNNIYDELIEIVKDENGDVQLITANAFQINMFSKSLLKSAQDSLKGLAEQGVELGIGTFTGLPILTDRGPKITLKLFPIGTVYTRFYSEFTTAGINQTNHKIYLIINTDVNIILPTDTKKVETTTEILITESIIVGKIPDTYLNSSQLDEMLNLVPKN